MKTRHASEEPRPREVRVGLLRFRQTATGAWTMDLGPLLLQITFPPRLDSCGGAGVWWWGAGTGSAPATDPLHPEQ